VRGDAETVETGEIVIRHSLVNSTSYSLNLTTADNLFAAHIYVEYRSRNPDKATVQEVMTKLQENNIDVSQLKEWPADNCPKVDSQQKEKVPH
jgi:hypothetical protein